MVSMIERIALDPNVPIEKLERMLAMQERIQAESAKLRFQPRLPQPLLSSR
jgi:hypothetical protein